MNIVVCIKQVPDTTEIKIDPKTGTLIREGVPTIINPEDKNAIEAALNLCDNGKVIALSMGPPQAEEALREALAMGVDEAILLCDRKLAGSDTWATANALAAAIRKLNYDLIICGKQAIDGDTGQVGPQIAENLGLPQLTYVKRIEIKGDKLIVSRLLEDGYAVIETKLPALVTVVGELNKPRYPSLMGIYEAYHKKKVKIWGVKDIDIDENKVGLRSSPTQVKRIFTPPPKAGATIIEGSPKEVASKIIKILKDKEIIQEF